MANFDASARESHMVEPDVTNTPLQALDLMNDVTFVEAARVLARAHDEGRRRDAAERIAFAFRLATARAPEAGGERRSCRMRSTTTRELFKARPDAALKYVSQGEYPRDETPERQRAGGVHDA